MAPIVGGAPPLREVRAVQFGILSPEQIVSYSIYVFLTLFIIIQKREHVLWIKYVLHNFSRYSDQLIRAKIGNRWIWMHF